MSVWEGFKTFLQTANLLLLIILIILVIVAFSNIFKMNRKINRIRKRYDNILKGRGELSLEALLLDHGEDIDRHEKVIKELIDNQNIIHSRVQLSLQKVGFYKYNAFPDLTNELSYTLVLLDNLNDGIMITSIYGRDQSTSFSKKIRAGKADVELSQEEKIALDKALLGE